MKGRESVDTMVLRYITGIFSTPNKNKYYIIFSLSLAILPAGYHFMTVLRMKILISKTEKDSVACPDVQLSLKTPSQDLKWQLHNTVPIVWP